MSRTVAVSPNHECTRLNTNAIKRKISVEDEDEWDGFGCIWTLRRFGNLRYSRLGGLRYILCLLLPLISWRSQRFELFAGRFRGSG